MVEHDDIEAGATCARLIDHAAARTVELDETRSVDIGDQGETAGVELLAEAYFDNFERLVVRSPSSREHSGEFLVCRAGS